jgi:hypothetical protein
MVSGYLDKWLVSRLGRFTSKEGTLSRDWIEGFV